MLLRILRYLGGYVKFSVTGKTPERFINLCGTKRKELWDITPTENGIEAYVKASIYKTLRPIARRCGVRIRHFERHGLPFIFHRYRFRTGMFLGPVIFIALLYFLSLFAWNVSVVGNNKIESATILNVLSEYGIKQGVMISKLDLQNLRQQILLDLPEISWLSINTNGTSITVEVSERTYAPEIIDTKMPCNVIAQQDGRIIEVRGIIGDTAVAVGDTVLKGELLVSGAVEYSNGVTVFKHATAEVIAETTHIFNIEIPLTQQVTEYTGENVSRSVLSFFHIKLPLYLGSVDGSYKKYTEEHIMKIGEKQLPIGIYTAKFLKTKDVTVTYSEDEANQMALQRLDELVKSSLSEAEVISQNTNYEIIENSLVLKGEIFCKENIAGQEKILLS